MSVRAFRVEPRKNHGPFGGATALMMSGCLVGVAARDTMPAELALGVCGLCGLGVLASLCVRKIAANRTSLINQLAQERALARIAHRIDRHIPRGAARTNGPHHTRKLSERQFMPVAQSSRRLMP